MRRKHSIRLRPWRAAAIGVALGAALAVPEAARAVCVLTCPADIARVSNSDTGVQVFYPTPTQSGCTGAVEQTSGLPSGFFFPPGQTTNSFRDTVDMGSTCFFNVVVRFVPPSGAPAVGPWGLAALAAGLAGLGAWAARRRRA